MRATPSEGWNLPTTLDVGVDVFGAPTIAASCRSVYFVHVASDGSQTIDVILR